MSNKIRSNKKKAFSLIELSIVILIIGILVAGVTQGSRLLQELRINTAITITQSSDVNSIEGLTLWLDAVNEESLKTSTFASINQASFGNINDDDKISAWQGHNPQDLQKITVFATSDDTRPTYARSGINNIPSLSFEENSYMQPTNLLPLTAGDDDYTMAFVVSFNATNNRDSVVAFQGPYVVKSDNNVAGIRKSNWQLYFFGAGNDASISKFANYKDKKTFVIIVRVNNSNSDNILFYVNKSEGTLVSSVDNTSLDVSDDRFAIGNRTVMDNRFQFQGLLSEIIYYDRALKKSEITSINNYLAKKYDVKLN